MLWLIETIQFMHREFVYSSSMTVWKSIPREAFQTPIGLASGYSNELMCQLLRESPGSILVAWV